MTVDETKTTPAEPLDGEVFSRVWDRVQAAKGTPAETEALMPAEAVLPLGEGSAGEGDFLRRQILWEIGRWQRCLWAAGNRRGSALLKECGGEALRHAKRLSAAYFLITGSRYLPLNTPAPPVRTSRESELRTLFREGQLGQRTYQQAALQTRDPALAVLYTDLAREEGICCNRLITVLEEWL